MIANANLFKVCSRKKVFVKDSMLKRRKNHLATYGSVPLTLGLIGRYGGLSTLCYSCGFACQQGMLKTFPGLGYLRSGNGAV